MVIQIMKCMLRKNYFRSNITTILKLYRCQEFSCSQFGTQKQSSPNISEDGWSELYKLPIISLAAAFNRLKIYQAGVTTIGIPISYALETTSQISDHGTIVFTMLGVTGFITLTLGSLVIRNLIGIIYINHTADKLKLSYVDFWGQRKNIQLSIDNIIPPYELPRKKIEFYQTVTTNEQNAIKLKLIQRFADISDRNTFSSIFGE